MNKMLSDALREYHGLREQLDRALIGPNADVWGEKLRALMRGEPVNTEGMIPIPIEISGDLGVAYPSFFEDHIRLRDKQYGPGWKLPTYKEMHRILEAGKLTDWVYYFTSKVEENNNFQVLRRHNAGLGSSSCGASSFTEKNCHLCLVREVKLPEGTI
jgi:hypothetical protein